MLIIKKHPADVVGDHLSEADRNTLNEIAEGENTTPGELAIEMLSYMLSAFRSDEHDSTLIILTEQGFYQQEAERG